VWEYSPERQLLPCMTLATLIIALMRRVANDHQPVATTVLDTP
jgi:hypothetical protein